MRVARSRGCFCPCFDCGVLHTDNAQADTGYVTLDTTELFSCWPVTGDIGHRTDQFRQCAIPVGTFLVLTATNRLLSRAILPTISAMHESASLEEELYVAMTRAWCRAFSRPQRRESPLRRHVFGPLFAERVVRGRGNIDAGRVAAVCAEISCRR